MTQKNRQRLYCALTTAAALIEQHAGCGHDPDDLGEEGEEGLCEYQKATDRAAKLIMTIAKRYES
ncbi:hypothetical protein [Tenacibaculum finnmarkense]|uniref:hypothetical protein n=1 Tax=Tenacibaculum finnmarkense TaxID=2781243 RepID=UPI000C5137C0|nr:hypothetical protein [Tenacibaculum finnmarkense]MBE7661502.1 hypothetical protein [Tenacibaculum finnmarkense genomovar finnmarkense]MCG8253193.1 hypothetical protein [Tenacibaculum finnmarkense genomovar finnmarkense]MCG8732213.1 hypothetical protein [Tenacibaculum finnmarkense]MCG8752939.1 hypothetical protein [Tenacibaculum finnmarkense]MCG8773769.1 hypothetical protein [Tenacibaculum finnmarkense]